MYFLILNFVHLKAQKYDWKLPTNANKYCLDRILLI